MTDLSIFERRFLSAAACACLRWCVASTCATSCLHYYMILLINSRLKAVNCKANKAPSVGVTLATLFQSKRPRPHSHLICVVITATSPVLCWFSEPATDHACQWLLCCCLWQAMFSVCFSSIRLHRVLPPTPETKPYLIPFDETLLALRRTRCEPSALAI